MAARAERAKSLGIHDGVDAKIRRRSRDWSQVRPEWGLARNAFFIAAPRKRTRGLNLNGRAFLHSYDWSLDRDFSILKMIMTAPMIVSSWIYLQYFASTVNNRVFGSGNKTLHNVVGTIGVLEGNAGDLKTGLPLQSVHDGQDIVHNPLRLNVLIEAPAEEIVNVIAASEDVRKIVENQWVHLFHISPDGAVRRYAAGGGWIACPSYLRFG
jgi:uncharacterized protein YbcC (UPF0753/DUF2309 family)